MAERLQEDFPDVKLDAKALAAFIPQLMQFMEDALGIQVRFCGGRLYAARSVLFCRHSMMVLNASMSAASTVHDGSLGRQGFFC